MQITGGRALVTSALLLAVGCSTLAGCTSDAPESPEAPSVTASSAAPEPSPTPSDTAEADVLAAYHRFWDARVAAERGNPDPGLFTGVAQGAIVEDSLAVAKNYAEFGIVREGAPVISDTTVTITGDTAVVSACVDHNSWSVPGEAETPLPPKATGVTLVRSDAGWLATAWS